MGIHPVRFLAVPRVVAAMIVTPLLCVVCNVMGILGGYVVMYGFGYTGAALCARRREREQPV